MLNNGTTNHATMLLSWDKSKRKKNEPFKFYGKNHNQTDPEGQGFKGICNAHTRSFKHLTRLPVINTVDPMIWVVSSKNDCVCAQVFFCTFIISMVLAAIVKVFNSSFTFVLVLVCGWMFHLFWPIKSFILFDFSLLPTVLQLKPSAVSFYSCTFCLEHISLTHFNTSIIFFLVNTCVIILSRHELSKTIIHKAINIYKLHSNMVFDFQSIFLYCFAHSNAFEFDIL